MVVVALPHALVSTVVPEEMGMRAWSQHPLSLNVIFCDGGCSNGEALGRFMINSWCKAATITEDETRVVVAQLNNTCVYPLHPLVKGEQGKAGVKPDMEFPASLRVSAGKGEYAHLVSAILSDGGQGYSAKAEGAAIFDLETGKSVPVQDDQLSGTSLSSETRGAGCCCRSLSHFLETTFILVQCHTTRLFECFKDICSPHRSNYTSRSILL